MDWPALALSLQLALATTLILLPLAVLIARPLAWRAFRGKSLVEALVALPLVLPPTVLGFYLLVAFGEASVLGDAYQALTGRALVFTFDGLLLASIGHRHLWRRTGDDDGFDFRRGRGGLGQGSARAAPKDRKHQRCGAQRAKKGVLQKALLRPEVIHLETPGYSLKRDRNLPFIRPRPYTRFDV